MSPGASQGVRRQLVTGAQYVQQITGMASDRRARAAFHELVLQLAQPGAKLFDFGCGTGMDARFFAEHGFKVRGYDVDRQMCEFFRMDCEDLMRAGRITLEEGGYQDFLARINPTEQPPEQLIISNFAPLNLIADLRGLFAKFHRLSAPNGRVFASVLNPYFLGDLKYRWWWRNLPALVRNGFYSVPGAQAPIFRRRLNQYAEQCRPYFTLQGVYRGLPASGGRRTRQPLSVSGSTWLRLITGRYMFLLFVRQ